MTSAISREKIHMVGYGFVDDVKQVESARTEEHTYREVNERMQQGLDTWGGGIRSTGGGLVPEKSSWVLVDFIWKQG